MAYKLGQYVQQSKSNLPAGSTEANVYMTTLGGGVASTRESVIDIGVAGDSGFTFQDECVKLNQGLTTNLTYYLHCKIKRLDIEEDSDQVFSVYLCNYTKDTQNLTQYLTKITVSKGTDWADFEIIFSPLYNFNCVLFQLQRARSDYAGSTRKPIIVYEELSKVNNAIAQIKSDNISFTKLGVQSNPGLKMCINGSEILVGRSGLYEIRNGIIAVNSFSIIQAAKDDNIDTILNGTTQSKCIFDNTKTRSIDGYVLDYMYKEA